ncbi:hypothetical protein [Legionella sp. WA2022007384]
MSFSKIQNLQNILKNSKTVATKMTGEYSAELMNQSGQNLNQLSWVIRHPTNALHIEVNKEDKLVVPEQIDLQKVLPILVHCSSEDTQKHLKKELKGATLANYFRSKGAVDSPGMLIDKVVQESLKRPDINVGSFTHSTTEKGLRAIVLDGHLREPDYMQGGMASQPGICMSTDIRSRSISKAIESKLHQPMLFYSADNSKVSIGRSAYALSDGTTVKANNVLPIQISATYIPTEGFEIIDSKNFAENQVGGLILNPLADRACLFQFISIMTTLTGDRLYDSDNNVYNLEDITRLPLKTVADIAERTLMDHAQMFDSENNSIMVTILRRAFHEYKEEAELKTKALETCILKCNTDPQLEKGFRAVPGLVEVALATVKLNQTGPESIKENPITP